ncbi:hypothetical protein [Streptomyces sp. NPDC091268]|uniref:hypothetical protein n=1 Tax=Streptomyces sp. NPDC091268 TaxID=3365979 RepID=UPI00380C05F7
MDEQGGAGGVPLDDEQAQSSPRKPHVDRQAGHEEDRGRTAAADTDEASRLDRPQQPEKQPSTKGTAKGTHRTGPRESGEG